MTTGVTHGEKKGKKARGAKEREEGHGGKERNWEGAWCEELSVNAPFLLAMIMPTVLPSIYLRTLWQEYKCPTFICVVVRNLMVSCRAVWKSYA